MRLRAGSGRPVFAGKQVCVCNSLASRFQGHGTKLATELDQDENGSAPSEVTAHSNHKVWSRNACRGSWMQAVHECTVYLQATAKVLATGLTTLTDSFFQRQPRTPILL